MHLKKGLNFDPHTFSSQKLCCRCDIKVARYSDADKLAMEETDAPTPGAIELYDEDDSDEDCL